MQQNLCSPTQCEKSGGDNLHNKVMAKSTTLSVISAN